MVSLEECMMIFLVIMPEQTKWINNALVFTDDYWVTAKCALGKFKIYNPILKAYVEQYGLVSDFVIADY